MKAAYGYAPDRRHSDQRYDRHQRASDPALAEAKRIRSSARWQKCRTAYLNGHPLCEDPFGIHAHKGVGTPADHVHHIRPLRIRPDLATDPDNLMALCPPCHAKVEAKMKHGKIAPKALLPGKVYLVCGPPGSGKTTFVRRQATPDDLILDYDRLMAAMTIGPDYYRPRGVRPFVRAARDAMLDLLKVDRPMGCDAWIIASAPKQAERDTLAASINAEETFLLDVDAQECKRRMRRDSIRRNLTGGLAVWDRAIDEWHEAARDAEGETMN